MATREQPIFGILAEFDTPEAILEAARRVRDEGYRSVEAYSPFPVHGLARTLGFRQRALPLIVLAGGVIGGLTGFGMQYWSAVSYYPMNIGGRPDNSWPAFIPVTFEMTILGAALFAVLGMLALNGLPMPYHPVFHVPEFKLASRDRFFILVLERDPLFDPERTRLFLEGLAPLSVREVEP